MTTRLLTLKFHRSKKSDFAAIWLGLSLIVGWHCAAAANTTIMKPLANPERSLWTLPDYTVTTPGKWTIVILNQKSIRFKSVDGTQNMQAGVVELHPTAKQTEDEAYRHYVDNRRELEHENIENKALKTDLVTYSKDQRGTIAAWCIIDPVGASGHLTAILENKRRLLAISYDVDKVTETEFRKDVKMVLESMALR